MGNFIIDQRLQKLEIVRNNLKKLKKKDRGNELTQVEAMINRLKGWDKEIKPQ